MANDAGQVVVGKPLATGGILVAPVGTPLPADESETLDAAFKPVGYIANDGVTKTENRESDTIAAWGGDTIAVTQTAYGVQWKFKMAEFLSAIAQRTVYGDANVEVTEATPTVGKKMHVMGKSTPAPNLSWIFEIFAGIKRVRIVVSDAQITETGDVTFKDDDIAVNDATLTSFPDADGNYFHQYSNDGRPAAA